MTSLHPNISNGTENSVIVATSGARLAMQTALALQEKELLKCLLMSFYYKEGSTLIRALSSLPEKISSKILREMRRRHLSGLNDSLVNAHPHIELPFLFLNRSPIPAYFKSKIAKLRNSSLIRSYRNTILKTHPKAVIAPDAWFRYLMEPCKDVNTISILDQNTGHITAMAKTLHEEQEIHPDMADSITPFSEKDIKECTTEALAADAILVSSDFAKDSLLDIGVKGERIHHIPYAADTERFTPKENKQNNGKIRFLFVGLIGQRKGIKYLLEAFKKLNLKDAELELVGVPLGSGDGLIPYRDLFIHTPSVPYQEIHQTFHNADIFVMPTLHESGVLAIHEALASGLPVITTPNAGSIVRDNTDGFIVPIRDIDALADKMLTLYQDRELRIEMSRNARKRAEEYNWPRYREQIAKTVHTLITSNR